MDREPVLLRRLVWDADWCVHCGACVGQCPSGALRVVEDTRKVSFSASRCTGCKLCLSACGYRAVELVGDRTARAGGWR